MIDDVLNETLTKARVWLRELHRWSAVKNTSVPRVFYGFDTIGGRESIVSGGIIKVQDLQVSFSNCVDEPNIFYLVSSALPSYAPLMAKMAKHQGARFILNQNGVAYPAWHGDGWEKTNMPLHLLVQAADYVFYQSKFCKMAADRFLGPCKGGWEILHNPVDTEYFKPGPPLSLDPVVLIQAGTHNHLYRVESAIRTLHELAKGGLNVRLLLAGRYNWRSRANDAVIEIELLAKTLGVSNLLELREGYTQDEAVSLFRSAHILLHTKYNDPCPRLVVEAMACGLPVVYSASGGVPELVGSSGGEGVSAPLDWEQEHPPDPKELADCVMKIISNYEYYAEGARQRATEYFDVKPWVIRHKTVFENLLNA